MGKQLGAVHLGQRHRILILITVMNKTYMKFKDFTLKVLYDGPYEEQIFYLEKTLLDGCVVRVVDINNAASAPLKDARFFTVLVVGSDGGFLNRFESISMYEFDSVMDLIENVVHS